jgi:hypothetical protein
VVAVGGGLGVLVGRGVGDGPTVRVAVGGPGVKVLVGGSVGRGVLDGPGVLVGAGVGASDRLINPLFVPPAPPEPPAPPQPIRNCVPLKSEGVIPTEPALNRPDTPPKSMSNAVMELGGKV